MEGPAFAGTKWNMPRAAVALAASAYFLWAAAHPADWRFIDGANLLFHEAGHVVFFLFGRFIAVAGGTLLQLIVPAVCAWSFWRTRQRFSAALTLFWFGENFLNISVYAADARRMQLPLLGDDPGSHDWNNMLSWLGVLGHADGIALAIRIAGTLVIFCAVYASFAASRRQADIAAER